MPIKTVNVSFPEQTLNEIDKFAKKTDLSRSDILRLGARKYIRSLEEWRLLQAVAEKKMRKMGLESEEDIIKKLRQ